MTNIKLFVMDVDGTLTDGKISYSSDGSEIKNFSVKDGIGIKRLLESNIIPAIISGRNSVCVSRRAKELGIVDCHQGIDDKTNVLNQLIEKYNLSLENVAYIGDDINDLDVMKMCKISGSPADAHNSVLNFVNYVSKYDGGEGAVRDFAEYIILHNQERQYD